MSLTRDELAVRQYALEQREFGNQHAVTEKREREQNLLFGLRNAGLTFQRYINKALDDLDFVYIYINDILISSRDSGEHRKHLRTVLDRLKEYNLRINVSKCQFAKTEIEFLGYLINQQGIRPTKEKVEAIVSSPKLKTVSDLRRFLVMVNFYRRNLKAQQNTKPRCQYFCINQKSEISVLFHRTLTLREHFRQLKASSRMQHQ